MKKKPAKSISKLKKEAWDLFSKYIRTRDCLKTSGTTEYGTCITCNKVYPFGQLQAGHFISSRTKPVLFNEEIVFSQCVSCNLFKHGNLDEYTPVMLKMYGTDKVLEFLDLRHNKDKTWRRCELEEIIERYKIKLDELQ